MENLDRLCAEYGYMFAEEVSKVSGFGPEKAGNLLTKALGVLEEQGLYAFTLFCESRGSTEEEGAKKIKEITTKLLKDELGLISNDNLLEEIRKENGLALRLDDLTLAIQVLEKSLIYARFHAKALSNSLEETKVSEEAT
ncbi:hypothetical protein [Caldisericum exile]|uniref:hypothetical protein n=1 Tax=Caldisericum exile TaxID=693075 RepID=UPI003C75F23F